MDIAAAGDRAAGIVRTVVAAEEPVTIRIDISLEFKAHGERYPPLEHLRCTRHTGAGGSGSVDSRRCRVAAGKRRAEEGTHCILLGVFGPSDKITACFAKEDWNSRAILLWRISALRGTVVLRRGSSVSASVRLSPHIVLTGIAVGHGD